MSHTTKIATCCYCGARAALVLEAGRHELSCRACGAPLHELKKLHREHPGQTELVRGPAKRRKKEYKSKYYADDRMRRKPKPKKRRKGLMKHLFEEAFDAIEDIFD